MAESHENRSTQDVSLRDRLPSVTSVGVGAAVLTLALLIPFGEAWAFSGPFTFRPLPALVAVGGVVAGPVGVVGMVVGYLCYQLVVGAFALWETVGFLLLGTLAGLFWRDVSPVDGERETARRYARFAVVGAVATLWTATAVTWGLELTGQSRFFPTFVFFTVDSLLSILTLGVLLYAAVARLGGMERAAAVRRVHPLFDGGETTARPSRFELFAIPLAWFVVGSVASVGFQVAELVPAFHFRLRGLGALTVVKNDALFGEGGSTVIVAGGAVCLALLVMLLHRWATVAQSR